jgi:cytochrome c-type biogenesis protein CcmH
VNAPRFCRLAGTAAAAWLIALLLSLPSASVHAQAVRDAAPLEFADLAEERRFNTLVAELRCVMCQNQSLADSNAQIAHDLRREVFELMRSGRSDREIKAYLVERYGEFVLYRPEVKGGTMLLWFGPFVILALGGAALLVHLRRRAAAAPAAPVAASASNRSEEDW